MYTQRTTIMPIDRAKVKICVCRKCEARYEPLPYQSLLFCSYCQPPSQVQPVCNHGVSLHLPCEQCHSMYGSAHMRHLPNLIVKPGPKRGSKQQPKQNVRPKRITMTRMKAPTF